MANGEKEPAFSDIIAWFQETFPSVAGSQPDKGVNVPVSTKSDWYDYLSTGGPIGQLLNSFGFSQFESLPWGMSDTVYELSKGIAEAEDPDDERLWNLSISGEYLRGRAQRNLIDFWRDKMQEADVPFQVVNDFRQARDRYIDNPSVETYREIQDLVTKTIPTAASPSVLENTKANLLNNYMPVIEQGNISASQRDDLRKRIQNARSAPQLATIKDEILTTVQTRVPGEHWSEQVKTEITERGGTRTPDDWEPRTTFTQQGLEELDGMPAFSGEYSQVGQQGRFEPSAGKDLIAEAIADLTGIDGWPVRLENGNVLIYRGTLPNGQPMLLGEFDWDEENSRLFKVGSGTSADPTSISTSVFVDAFGNEKLINSETGEVIRDLGVGFDAVESGRDFTENQRQFSATYGLQRDRLTEDQRQFDLGLGEDVRQFDMSFGEGRRQFDTTEGRMERTLAANNYFNSLEELGRNYRTFIQTAPQMANAATNQGQLIADILRSGGDVLARTYFTRGGISPLPEITQADLINNLNSEMAKIQQFEVDATTAENRRREAADLQRAQGEYAQFKSARQRDAQRAYDQYKAGLRPYQVSSEVSTPNVAGFEAARDKYREETAGQLSDMAKSFAQLPGFVIDKQFGGMDRQTLSDMADEAAGLFVLGALWIQTQWRHLACSTQGRNSLSSWIPRRYLKLLPHR